MGKTCYGYCCTRRSNELSSPSPPANWNWRGGSYFPRKTGILAILGHRLAERGEHIANAAWTMATLSHSENSRVDSFLAKVRIQGNWPSQTASLPARPPMQGAGYGPRHTAIENTVLAVDDNAVTRYQQSL